MKNRILHWLFNSMLTGYSSRLPGDRECYSYFTCETLLATRMHSSMMRTGRALTVFRSLLFPDGGLVRAGVVVGGSGPEGEGEVDLVPGGVWSRGRVWYRGVVVVVSWSATPPVNRMTNRCKNITLAKSSFRPVMIALSAVQSCTPTFIHNVILVIDKNNA